MSIRNSITYSVGARVGLLGNPSDDYNGKTISCVIRNFSATVSLIPSDTITIKPNTFFDNIQFGSLEDLNKQVTKVGYYGGLRILWAMCNVFYKYCQKEQIELKEKGFELRYDTTIPRQVGLSGSSALEIATFKCLMEYYSLNENHIPKHLQPNIVSQVDAEELGFSAGLQDEVTQILGGLVYMDFCKKSMEERGFGYYENINPQLLPPLYLAYEDEGREEGQIHSDVRDRWHKKDPIVRKTMTEIAICAKLGKTAIETQDREKLFKLMNLNFDWRRRAYGDAILGKTLEMVLLARKMGLCAKSAGSGGAIVGIIDENISFNEIMVCFNNKGFKVVQIEI